VYHNKHLVVPQEEARQTLERLWGDPLYTQTTPARFHNRLKQEFEGLPLASVTEFLEKKGTAQSFKHPPRPERTPINTKRPKVGVVIL
jgi:hypothetical protein